MTNMPDIHCTPWSARPPLPVEDVPTRFVHTSVPRLLRWLIDVRRVLAFSTHLNYADANGLDVTLTPTETPVESLELVVLGRVIASKLASKGDRWHRQ